MKKLCYVLTVLLSSLLISAPVFGFGQAGVDVSATPAGTTVPENAQDLTLTLRVPVLSPYFIETPVASVDGQPILLGEFSREFSTDQQSAGEQQFSARLDTLLKAKQNSSDSRVELYVDPGSIDDQHILIRAPIFSPLFVDTPVAVVNGEPIVFSDFTQNIISMYTSMEKGEMASHDYLGLLERLITAKLVVFEAENIGIHETISAEKQISTFSAKALAKILLQEYTKDVQPVESEVKEAYQFLSQEVNLITVQINTQTEAQEFLDTYQEKGGFEDAAAALAKLDKGSVANDGSYIHINELLPNVKSKIAQMKIGDVSPIFKAPAEGYLVFKLLDRRFVEDQEIFLNVQSKNLEKERQALSLEYIETLEEKYVRYDEKSLAALDFEAVKSADPDLDLRDYMKQLREDQRVLVTFEGGGKTQLTIAEVADKINSAFYHGLEETVTAEKLEEEKEKALYNLQFEITSRLEGEKLGIDKSERYLSEVDKFTSTLLFERFLEQVIAPEVSITEDDIRDSYKERIAEFSSPAMLKMKSLVFESREEAEKALQRLQSGSDYKWVSANSNGLVGKDAEGVLPFEGKLLSVTALPEGIQDAAANAASGHVLLYNDPDKYVYVLQVDAAYPPQPKAYESVRSEVGQALYNKKFQQILDHWISRLKEAYETEVFLVGH